MKISVNWIKQFVDFDLPPTDELVQRIGAQLGGVEEVEDIGAKYQGIVVAKVVSCRKHENSDHLSICLVDDGGVVKDVARNEQGLVQVVCGAPNVREGLTVAWLPPGATVPETVGKDPFVLSAREFRGELSNGMLASMKELALGDNHDGILEIDKAVAPGTPFVEVYKLDDTVVTIENKMFTHRPDCFGVLGVAREIAGILGQPFHSPEWYQPQAVLPAKQTNLPLRVSNELPELVPRFSAVTLSDVTVGPSPIWLQVALAKLGQKSISNLVDLTNFYMLVTGQPLHAYDYDKVQALTAGEGAEITVRHPRPGEKIALLNGKTIEPRPEAIMIASGDALIGVGGVMGGSDTEVSAETKNIIVEAASFDMYSIRRTSMAHGLFTDAVTRFNKGQSPLQTVAVLAKVVEDVQQMASAKVASDLIDVSEVSDRLWVHPPVPVTTEFINTRLGFQLTADEMKNLLENVECQVQVAGQNLTVTAPFWRTDIETREDIVEEVGRLYGFDKLPVELPQRSIVPAAKDALLEHKKRVREVLSQAGANEVLTYSFVHGDLLQKVGQNPEQAFQISNALSPDLQYYRLSLTPSLLDKVQANLKAGYHEFALFELGKSHNKEQTDDEGLPVEFEMLELVYARSDKLQKPGAAFYEARRFLRRLANQFGIELEYRPIAQEEDYQVAKPYDHTRSAQVFVKGTNLALGMVGEYKANVLRAFKLPKHTAGFGIGLAQLMQAAKEHETIPWYSPLSRFPSVTQDITFKLAADQLWQPFYSFLREQVDTAKPAQSTARISPMDIYQSNEDTAHKQFSFRISIAHFEKTMTDTEVNKLLEVVATAAKTAFGAERI